MTTNNFLFILSIFLLASCTKHENAQCTNTEISKISSTTIGQYGESSSHLMAIDLGNEICLISRSRMKHIPYDTTKEVFEIIDEHNFDGVAVNQYDTIILRDNIFYRYYPSERRFEHIYTPSYFVFDFCVTPNHGIGFIWGSLFHQPDEFNYFDFDRNRNYRLFLVSELIEDNPVYNYQTYIKDDSLKLLMLTGYNASAYKILYDVDLAKPSVLYREKIEYPISRDLDFGNCSDIRLNYVSGENFVVSDYDWITKQYSNKYSFPRRYTERAYSIDSSQLSVVLHYDRMEFIDRGNIEKNFTIDLPTEYHTLFAETEVLFDQYVILYQQKSSQALVYDLNGCVKQELYAKHNIKDVLMCNKDRIVIRNDLNQVELFELK